jgi:hypothetical protein
MVEWLRSGHVIRETFAVIFVAISSIILISIMFLQLGFLVLFIRFSFIDKHCKNYNI